jgi:sugar phosphate permease
VNGLSQQVAGTAIVRPAWFSLRFRIFAVTWLAYAGFYLCRKNFSVLMPFLQNEAGISKLRLADILFAYSLCYSAGQFLMGSLADRFSPRVVVGFGLLISSAVNIGMAFNPTFGVLLTLGMVNGLAQSAGWPGLNKTMASWFRPEERGVVMGWWTTCYVFGGFAATIVAAWCVSGRPWRTGFVLPAILLLAVAAVFTTLVRDRPGAAVDWTAAKRSPLANYREVMAQPVAWATAAAGFLLKVMRYSFLFWLPLYLTERLAYKPEQAGYLSSVFEFAGIGGALAAGYASDKLLRARRYPVTCVMLMALAAACLIQPRLAALGWLGALAGIALIGVMTFGPDTIVQGAACQDVGGIRCAASAAGLVNGVASLGQLASPYLVALVAERWGWDTVFSVFVAIALAGSAVTAPFWNYRSATDDILVQSALADVQA